MNHNLGFLSSGVKFALHLIHFMSNFELQLQEAAKFFSYFWLQLVRMGSSEKPCPRFLITFLFFEILAKITFLFPLKSVLKIENSGYFLKCTPFLKELRQRFFELELEHSTLTENPHRRLLLFHWYCNFNRPARLNDIWYLWNTCSLAKISSSNLFFVWRFWHFLNVEN